MRIYTVWNYRNNLKFVTTSEDQAKAYKTELFNGEHESFGNYWYKQRGISHAWMRLRRVKERGCVAFDD